MARNSMKEFGKDKKSFANMPQEVKMEEYPKQSSIPCELDDTIEGIDEVVEHSQGRAKSHQSYQK